MSTFRPTVGIDVGKDALHVAVSAEGTPIKALPVHLIPMSAPDWSQRLAALIPPGADVGLEPTGWHYSNPVITWLDKIGAQVWIVEHRITRHVRELRVSGVKNDRTDARALCYAVSQAVEGSLSYGISQADPGERAAVTALRTLVFAHLRADKEVTRSRNRLRQLAYSMWPALSHSIAVYLRAVSAGAVTPPELHALAHKVALDRPPAYEHGNARNALFALVDELPSWLDQDHLKPAIVCEAQALQKHQQRKAQLEPLIESMVGRPPFDPLTETWLTIPGAGLLSIAAVHAATRAQADLITPEQFRACCACHPRTATSGQASETEMARQGFKPAKRALHMWVMRLARLGDNPIAHLYARRAGHKHNHAAARAKLCNILSALARTGQPYHFDRDEIPW